VEHLLLMSKQSNQHPHLVQRLGCSIVNLNHLPIMQKAAMVYNNLWIHGLPILSRMKMSFAKSETLDKKPLFLNVLYGT